MIEKSPEENAELLPREAGSRSLSGQAYDYVRTRILDNDWAPGFTILEQALCELLGMSRTPVREALVRMQDEGLVKVVPRHGMKVLPVSVQDMGHIYQILTSLESTAAELAAKTNDRQESCDRLDAATSDMERALELDELNAWAQADERFHRLLLDMSGNPILAETIYRFWDRAHRARMFTLRLRVLPRRSTQEHRDLAQAIRNGDAFEAARIHHEHRTRGSREMMRILEQANLTQV